MERRDIYSWKEEHLCFLPSKSAMLTVSRTWCNTSLKLLQKQEAAVVLSWEMAAALLGLLVLLSGALAGWIWLVPVS